MDTKNHACRTRTRAGISGCTSVTGRIRDNSFLLKGGDSTACKSFLVTLSTLFIKLNLLDEDELTLRELRPDIIQGKKQQPVSDPVQGGNNRNMKKFHLTQPFDKPTLEMHPNQQSARAAALKRVSAILCASRTLRGNLWQSTGQIRKNP